MLDNGRRSTMLWLLVCSVLLGLVTMHHVVNQHGEHGGASAATPQVTVELDRSGHDDSPAPAHDSSSVLGHLCFAILVGSIALLIAVRLIRHLRDTASRLKPLAAQVRGERAPPSRPLPTTSGFAYDLCVLRL